MKTAAEWSLYLPKWLAQDALPLWTGVGFDPRSGTVWEALDHDGKPLEAMQKRLRVQVRQAYCFAQSSDASHRALALRLFRFSMDHGFDRTSGHLAATLTPDAQISAAPHDLYDIAFMLLAASALIDAGFDVDADLARLEDALGMLKAPRGWHENAAHTLPRRQNPHMHMFEAAVALYASTKEARFKVMADECLDLFRDVFCQNDGRVLEFFDPDWSALPAVDQAVEPGHMAEWVFLLDRYETATGQPCGVDLDLIFGAIVPMRDAVGLLPDRSEPARSETRRLWPQTELLKAALVMEERKSHLSTDLHPVSVLNAMWREYFVTPVAGGWYDQRTADGLLVSSNMPASTFYHVYGALQLFCRSQTTN